MAITLPFIFVNGTVADGPQVNANFNALISNTLPTSGGTIAGTLSIGGVVTSGGVPASLDIPQGGWLASTDTAGTHIGLIAGNTDGRVFIGLNDPGVVLGGAVAVTGTSVIGSVPSALDIPPGGWLTSTSPGVSTVGLIAITTAAEVLIGLNAVGVALGAASAPTTVQGDLHVNGIPYAPQANFTVPSDPRVKTEIGSYSSGLEAILALNPIKFRYNGRFDTPIDRRDRVGLDASAVRQVAPELIGSRNADDAQSSEILTLDPGPLTYMLINSVRSLVERIEQLTERVAALERTS